jgi:hypothetical protein
LEVTTYLDNSTKMVRTPHKMLLWRDDLNNLLRRHWMLLNNYHAILFFQPYSFIIIKVKPFLTHVNVKHMSQLGQNLFVWNLDGNDLNKQCVRPLANLRHQILPLKAAPWFQKIRFFKNISLYISM